MSQARRLRWWQWLLLLGALLLFAVQAGWSSTRKSAAFDEQYHLAAGYSYLVTGDFRLATNHPPLAGLLAALPLLGDSTITLPTDHPSWQSGDRFLFSDIFLWESGNDAQSMLLRARGSITLLGVALVASLFFAARQMLGGRAGWLALLLATFEPNLIAHSRFVTTDLALTLFIFLAVWAWWGWLVRARWRDAILAGVFAGLAMGTKYNGALVWGVIGLAMLIQPVTARRKDTATQSFAEKGQNDSAHFSAPALRLRASASESATELAGASWRQRLAGLAAAALAAVTVLWTLYRFTVGPVDFLPGWLPLPAPHYWQWFWNTIVRIIDLQGARVDFFLGEAANRSWWNYFFVAAGVKLPLPVLLLALTGFVLLVRERSVRRWCVLWLPPALLLLLGATQVLNIGFRHMLPAIPFLVLLGASVAERAAWLYAPRWRTVAATALLAAWLVVDVARIAPHYESFFNQLAGPWQNWSTILVDSNLDWGQDLIELRRVMDERGIDTVNLAYFGKAAPEAYGVRYRPLPSYLRFMEGREIAAYNPYTPEPGWYAISATALRTGTMTPETVDLYQAFRNRAPDARAGYSIYLYNLTYPPETEVVRPTVLGAPIWTLAPETLGLTPDNRAMVKWLESPDSTLFAQGEGFTAAEETGFQPVSANFADVLTLLGYTNHATQAHAGETVDLTLYWQVGKTPMRQPAPARGAPLSAFVHLVDGDPARKVAEFDAWHTALRGLEPGDVIAQRVTLSLPAETPANRYDLLVGLYSPQDWQRLATMQEGITREYAVAGQVEVAPWTDRYAQRLALFAGAASLAAHLLFWIEGLPVALRVALVLLAAGAAPGVLLVEWFLGARYGEEDAARLEKLLYGLGAGYLLMITTALAVSYLPGGVAAWQVLLPADIVLVGTAAALWRRAATLPEAATFPEAQSFREGEHFAWPDRRSFWVSVLLVLITGALLRLPDLGYSEFQGDEARVMLRASEVIEGYENALFAHQKMPGEILVESAVYAVTRQMDETAARLPFTVAGLAGLLGVLLLGARLFGPVAGVSAGLLAALTGYFVAFARIVQYQSLVLLAVVLAILVLWRLLDARRDLWRYFAVAALLAALGVLAHYEAAGIAAPVIFLLWRLWRGGVRWAALLRALVLPLLLFAAPVLLFAIPFVQDPTFAAAYAYAVGYRVDAGGFPYNNLVDFFARASLYNSAYYILLLALLAYIALVGVYRRNLPARAAWLLALVAGGGLLITCFQPGWLILGGVDHTWLFFAALLVAPWLAPRVEPAERLLWWWFGTLALFSLFVVQRPNSHVYTFFIPWVLLGGMVLARGAGWVARRFSVRAARGAALLVGGALVVIFGFYLHRLFVYNTVEVLRQWPTARPFGYWMPFTDPPEVAIFGFPHKSGWKVIGVHYAEGALEGNFLTNEKPEVVDWYTRGAGACPRGDRYFIVASRAEPQADAAARELAANVANEFSLRQVVEVQGESRLHLFDQPGDYEVETLDLAPFARRFDQELTGPAFVDRRGRVVAPAIQHRLDYRLGDEIELLGYDLDRTEAAPGELLHLTLYWRALKPMQNAYTVFNQVIDLATTGKAGQVDGMPVCDRNPTGQWFAGDVIADPYAIPLAPDAAPGTYTLISGMYNPATGERLEMKAPDGGVIGREAALATVVIR